MVSLFYAEKFPKINQCLRNKYIWQHALTSQIINVKISFNAAITFMKFTCVNFVLKCQKENMV